MRWALTHYTDGEEYRCQVAHDIVARQCLACADCSVEEGLRDTECESDAGLLTYRKYASAGGLGAGSPLALSKAAAALGAMVAFAGAAVVGVFASRHRGRMLRESLYVRVGLTNQRELMSAQCVHTESSCL